MIIFDLLICTTELSTLMMIVLKNKYLCKINVLECLAVGKILSQVFSLQESISAVVYPWYTYTENNERIDQINSITLIRTFDIKC